MSTKNSTPTTAEKLGINDICAEYGLSRCYVQRSIAKGKLPTELVEIGKNTFKHFATREDVEAWRSGTKSRTSRVDGRNKFVMYATPDEYADLQQILAERNNAAIVERANQPKSAE